MPRAALQPRAYENYKSEKFSQFSKVASFRQVKVKTKNFNSNPSFFNLVKLATISPAAYFFDCVNIGKVKQEAIIFVGFQNFF